MSDAVILSLITVLGGGVGTWIATNLRERNETRRTSLTTSSDVHKAELESDAQFMERLLRRIDNLEERQAEGEKREREQDKKIASLEMTQERIGGQYENNRKLMARVARLLRTDRLPDEETLLELENATPFAVLISATRVLPVEVAPPGGGALT